MSKWVWRKGWNWGMLDVIVMEAQDEFYAQACNVVAYGATPDEAVRGLFDMLPTECARCASGSNRDNPIWQRELEQLKRYFEEVPDA